MISSAARPEPPGGSRQYFSAEFHRYQTAALSLCLGICWDVLVNYYPNFATVDDLLLSSYIYRLERKKGRLVDRFSDELLREIWRKRIDAGSHSLSSLLLLLLAAREREGGGR